MRSFSDSYRLLYILCLDGRSANGASCEYAPFRSLSRDVNGKYVVCVNTEMFQCKNGLVWAAFSYCERDHWRLMRLYKTAGNA